MQKTMVVIPVAVLCLILLGGSFGAQATSAPAPQSTPSPAFQHRVFTAGWSQNICPGRNYASVVDNPMVNGNPDAMLLVTPNYRYQDARDSNGAGPAKDVPAVFYDKTNQCGKGAGRWVIYNLGYKNTTPMPMVDNTYYNVVVANYVALLGSGPNAMILHKVATSSTLCSIHNYASVIDDPRLNGNENADLVVTPNYRNADGSNANPAGPAKDTPAVFYDKTNQCGKGAGKWYVYGLNSIPMVDNTFYNVLALDLISPSLPSYRQTVDTSTNVCAIQNYTTILPVDFGYPEAVIVATPNFLAGDCSDAACGGPAKDIPAVYYDAGNQCGKGAEGWALYDLNATALVSNTNYNYFLGERLAYLSPSASGGEQLVVHGPAQRTASDFAATPASGGLNCGSSSPAVADGPAASPPAGAAPAAVRGGAPTTLAADSPAAQAGFTAFGYNSIDPQVAASRSHLVSTQYDEFEVYSKAGQNLYNQCLWWLFQPLRASYFYTTESYYDARVMFDSYRNRFWIVAQTFNRCCTDQTGNEQLRQNKTVAAVSNSENPLDGWTLYWWNAVVHDGACTNPYVSCDPVLVPGDAGDYPRVGIDSCCVLYANGVVNNWQQRHGVQNVHTYEHTVLASADDLAAGKPGAAVRGWEYWDLLNSGGGQDLMMPLVHHGPSPYSFFVSRYYSNSLIVWGFSGELAGQPQVTRAMVEIPKGFDLQGPGAAPQRDTSCPSQTGYLDLGYDTVGTEPFKAIYRAGRLYVVTVDTAKWDAVNKYNAIHLVRLDVSYFPFLPNYGSDFIDLVFGGNSMGTPLDPPGQYFHYGVPALEVNKLGDMAIVYARANASHYPEIGYSLYKHDETDIRRGYRLMASANSLGLPKCNPTDRTKISDLAGAAVDPSDDLGIWFAQTYADGGRNGTIHIDKVQNAWELELPLIRR